MKMLKIIKAILLATVISIGLVGCSVADLSQEPTNLGTEPEVVKKEKVEVVFSNYVYESEECGFVLSFSDRWGDVEEEIINSDASTSFEIVLTSIKNPHLTFTVDAITGDHSRYTTPIGMTEKCALYVDFIEEDLEAQEIAKTFAVVNEDGTATYSNELAEFSFDYPKEKNLDVREMPYNDPAIYITVGKKYQLNAKHEFSKEGYLSIELQRHDFDEITNEKYDGLYIPITNPCEDEDAPGGYAPRECEKVGDMTSYFRTEVLGEKVFSKQYYFDRDNEEWPELNVRVDLTTDDYIEVNSIYEPETFADQFESGELTKEQKERLEIAQTIVNTLQY